MVVAFWPWGFDSPAPTYFFGGNISLTARPLTGGVALSGFTVFIWVPFRWSIYAQIRVYSFRAFPVLLNGNKSGAKVVNLCRRFSPSFCVPLFG